MDIVFKNLLNLFTSEVSPGLTIGNWFHSKCFTGSNNRSRGTSVQTIHSPVEIDEREIFVLQ